MSHVLNTCIQYCELCELCEQLNTHYWLLHFYCAVQTNEVEVLNTEQQMADAKMEVEEDLDADAALLGVKRKVKSSATPAAAATAEGEAAGGEAGTSTTEDLVRV